MPTVTNSPKYTCYLIYFSVLTIITLLIIMEAGLSYVNEKGCYRSYTFNSGILSEVYQNLYNPIQAQCQQVV
jgi:hypothetical protein